MRSLIDLPFFGLSELPAFETRAYDDGKVRIEVQPGRRGLATIWDRKILHYALQVMQGAGGVFGSMVSLRPDSFFASCTFSSLDQSAHGLKDALERLRSTSIRTTIENERGQRESRFFSWIHTATMRTEAGCGRTAVKTIEVVLADWVWQPIFENNSSFQTSPAAFTVTSGISWRVNDLANRHVGHRKRWSTSLATLGEKLGYLAVERRRLAQEIQHVIAANDLPNFEISVRGETLGSENIAYRLSASNLNEDITVTFTKRDKILVV